MTQSLTPAEARRLALAAQGWPGARRSEDAAGMSSITKLVDRLNLLQIDSVNVLARSHYLPVFSRLGPYDPALLDRLTFAKSKRRLFEYWAHEASFLPLRFYPLLRWRMDAARHGEGVYQGTARFGREQQPYVAAVLDEVRHRGPLTVRELPDPGKRTTGWWGWSAGKVALEYLFWVGDLTVSTRRNFERIYDLTERVIPSPVLNAPVPARADATRELTSMAARALGIATAGDLRDYFRLPLADSRRALAELVEGGELMKVAVDGWKHEAFMPKDSVVPRKSRACASLLSPFDPLVWERARAERLFGFSYRIEIYTPRPRRKYGYYVLPFLLGDRFVARLCLKADRQGGALLVNRAHEEEGSDREATASALAHELKQLAQFLALERVVIKPRTGLGAELKRRV